MDGLGIMATKDVTNEVERETTSEAREKS